nr:T-protein-like [Nerophis lumbriciformis]
MLEKLREELTAVDLKLLELVAKRQQIVAEIGKSKRDVGRATRDFEREKRVIDTARKKADELGLSADLAQQMMQLLIGVSLEKQERDSLAHATDDGKRRALIIGGAGQMGRWFADFLASQGISVSIADPSPEPLPFDREQQWQSQVDVYDLIVVAAPIKISAAVLTELGSLRPSALIFDISSLKSPLREPLRALADAGCKVTSVHPMFGPDTRLLTGRHVIFSDVGNAEAVAEARALFAPTMAEQVTMSLEDHDRLIGYVLGLSHALNIAFFTALRESGEAAGELAKMSSTTFDAQLAIAGNVADENPHMYYEIQRLNDYRSAPLSALRSAINRLVNLIENGDEAGFVKLMQGGRSYLEQRATQ